MLIGGVRRNVYGSPAALILDLGGDGLDLDPASRAYPRLSGAGRALFLRPGGTIAR